MRKEAHSRHSSRRRIHRADIYYMMQLGAAGVQMATRFVPTVECDASDVFKKCYIDAQQDDIGIIKKPCRPPGKSHHQ